MSILDEIRRRRAAVEACVGHQFTQVKPEGAQIPRARGWTCGLCGEFFDAHEVSMYRQGVRDGERGHMLAAVLPHHQIPPTPKDTP